MISGHDRRHSRVPQHVWLNPFTFAGPKNFTKASETGLDLRILAALAGFGRNNVICKQQWLTNQDKSVAVAFNLKNSLRMRCIFLGLCWGSISRCQWDAKSSMASHGISTFAFFIGEIRTVNGNHQFSMGKAKLT